MSEVACWAYGNLFGNSQNSWYVFHITLVCGLIGAIAFLDARGERWLRWLPTGCAVLGLFSVVIALCWLPNFARLHINPDEDQWIALANDAAREPLFFMDHLLATTSMRELTVVPLIPLSLFSDGNLDYGGTRLVAALMWAIFASCIYKCVTNCEGRQAGLWTGCGLVVLISFLSCWDYIAYNSELPVILLCAAAMAMFSSTLRRSNVSHLLLAGLFLGLIPFAKKQGLPLSLAIAGIFVFFLLSRRDFRKIVWLLLGGLIGLTLFPGLYLVSGNWNEVLSVQRVLHEYAQHGFQGSDRSWYRGFLNLREMLVRDELRPLFLGALLVSPVLFWKWCCERDSWSDGRALLMWTGLATLAAALFAVWFPGNLFHHYALLLVFPCSLLFGCVAGMLLEVSARYNAWRVAYIMILLSVLGIYRKDGHEGVRELERDCVQQRQSVFTPTILEWAKPGDRMLVWGWWPAYFVETGLLQGARWMYPQFVASSFQSAPKVVQDYLQDLASFRPRVIVEWVGPDAVHFKDPEVFGLRAVPEINNYIMANYELVETNGNQKLFVRKE